MTEEKQNIPTDSLELPDNILSRLAIKWHLARTENQALARGAMLFVAVAFLPILFLSIIDDIELGRAVDMPLYRDLITLSRYLLAAPILILSDRLTRPWLVKAISRFCDLLDRSDIKQFKNIVKRVFKIRGSVTIDLLLLAFSFASSFFLTSFVLDFNISSWQTSTVNGAAALTRPGYWNTFISQPLFRFVVLSWLVDYTLWVYLLFRVSRFRLNVIATHPDRAGGLSFVSAAHSQYCLAAFALSCAVCSAVMQSVQHAHLELQSLYNLGLVFLAGVLLIFVGPLIIFSPTLLKTKLNGIISYGSLCHELSNKFAAKWIAMRQQENESILSSPDPSSLADLNSSFDTVQTMRPIVFDHQFVFLFVIATCLPALPLVATVIPLQDLIMQIFKTLT
ncbi:MAG: hypothetical protein K8F91_24570 [Candidatus Obscuribacterales bacterium]|nr:hypothetical protein [Candidatus Obscuribacterales bacterium]